MNINEIYDKVSEKLKNFDIEIRKNIIYCVRDRTNGKIDKLELKEKFSQGDSNFPYTEVTVDISDDVKILVKNTPIYIYGEYIKTSRNMTQTPLRISGKLKCDKSVSDFCLQIKSHFDAKFVSFIPSGREDIDVRMIGGRPFILEVKEPKKNLESSSLNLKLYKEIKLKNLCFVDKKCKKSISDGESISSKTYQLLAYSKKRINIKSHYALKQKTPLRVLHRRANIVREKIIEILNWVEKCEDDGFYYDIKLKSSAGTYIKEFVNGDFGRTVPSLSTYDNYCDILELDVLEVIKDKPYETFIIKKIDVEYSYE